MALDERVVAGTVEPTLEDGGRRGIGVDDLRADHLGREVETDARVAGVVGEVARQQHDRSSQERELEDRRRVVGDQDVGQCEHVVDLIAGIEDDVVAIRRDRRRIHVRMDLEHERVIGRQLRAKAGGVERGGRRLLAASTAQRRGVEDDLPTGQHRMRGEESLGAPPPSPPGRRRSPCAASPAPEPDRSAFGAPPRRSLEPPPMRRPHRRSNGAGMSAPVPLAVPSCPGRSA